MADTPRRWLRLVDPETHKFVITVVSDTVHICDVAADARFTSEYLRVLCGRALDVDATFATTYHARAQLLDTVCKRCAAAYVERYRPDAVEVIFQDDPDGPGLAPIPHAGDPGEPGEEEE